ncbi:MAG: ABC transporter substrate-binding protein [Pseudomonadota bacterium]
MRRTLLSLLMAAVLAPTMSVADELVLASLTYRTGPYAVGGVQLSDGFADYVTLLNERDGGINGQPVRVVECEFGYNTERGVECYKELLAKGALAFQPFSTGLTYALMDLAQKDGVVIHTTGYGLTAAADGASFPWVFNFPAHYWHAATTQIRHLKEANGGSLRGATIVHAYHNSGYGREPIPTLETLAEAEGFNLVLQPIDHPGEDQSAIWPEIAKAEPDYILLWGWGIMNRRALEGARDIGFPMDRMMGVWWSASESDVKPLRRDGNGYKAVTFHDVGTAYPVYNTMNELVYFAGKARGEMNNIGSVLYNRGVANAIFATEAIRKAMEIHNTTDITRAMVRDGYEQLEISTARYEELGMNGFTPPIQVSCRNHGGAGLVAVKQWDANRRAWDMVTSYYEPDSAVIDPAVKAAASAFAGEKGIVPNDC